MDPNDATYYVVINHELQYSIWPNAQPPAGWQIVGQAGSRDECLARIETLWTDMRPLSLREFMAAAVAVEDEVPEPDPGPDLVTRLCSEQDVEVELFAPASPELLRERLESGVLHLRFPHTRGGTLLAVALDDDARPTTTLDPAGRLELRGRLQLDFEDVRCRASISIADLRGRGRLIR